MRRLEFELTGLPKMANHGLRGTHWAVKLAEARKWKKLVAQICLALWRGGPAKKAKLTLTRFSSVAPDSDGLVSGFKHVIDGLVECGVLENDKVTNIGMPTYQWEKASRGHGKIQVIVEEMGEQG